MDRRAARPLVSRLPVSLVPVSLLLIGLVLPAPLVAADPEKVARKKERIDTIADFTLGRLFERSPRARELFEQSYGYAVFDARKVSVLVGGGGGTGVAVNREENTKVYMKMASGGVGLSLGMQFSQVVFLFQDRTAFERFVTQGWQAEAEANAVVGRAGANKEATFTHGVAIFQLTDAGLMLSADISGTKYWRSKKLNR